MKPRFSHQTNRALTLVEVVVIISVLVVLLAPLLPANIGSRRKAMRISCVNNLKEIDVADRIWWDGPPDYPTQVSITNGGTMELARKELLTLISKCYRTN